MVSDRWLYGWALGYAGVGAASLLVPLYAIELGGDAFLVGLLASTSAFAGVPGAIIWGKLSARTRRRRPFVLVALGALAVVLAIIPFISTPWPLLVANVVLWFVVAATAPVMNLIVVSGVPESAWERRIGLLNHYQGYGWLAGLAGGAVWTAVAIQFGTTLTVHRIFFAILTVTTVLAYAIVSIWYPEPSRISTRRFQRAYRRIDGRGGWEIDRIGRGVPMGARVLFWRLGSLHPHTLSRQLGELHPRTLYRRITSPLGAYLLAVTLFFVGFFVFFGPLPAVLANTGLASGEIFLLYVLASGGSAVWYNRAGMLATRIESGRLQSGALGIRAVTFPLVALVALALVGLPSLVVLGAVFVVVGITWAVIAVTATGIVTRLAPADVRAEALGAYTAIASFGSGIGAAVGGALVTTVGPVLTFTIAGILVLVGGIIVWRRVET